MKQTRFMSCVETITSLAIGFAVSMAINAVVMPVYGFHPTVTDNVQITVIFTAASVLRSYIIRRFFASFFQ